MAQTYEMAENQRYLTTTGSHSVALTPLPRTLNQQTPQATFAMQSLPEEVVREIIRIALLSSTQSLNLLTARRLCLVCKHFCELARPHLYHTIDLGTIAPTPIRKASGNRRLRRLQRTFQGNRYLADLCKSAHIHIDFAARYVPRVEDYREGSELLTLLTGLRSLAVHGGFEHLEAWLMLHDPLRNMPALRSMSLSRELDSGPPLIQISNDVDLPNLLELSLSGPSDGFLYPPYESIKSKSCFVPPHRKFTSPLKKLDFKYPEFTPEALKEFMTWPAALEHLILFGVHRTFIGLFDSFTGPRIGEILVSQRHSLRRLKLGPFKGTIEDLDLHDFGSLEELSIDIGNVPKAPTRSSKALLGKALQTFNIDCRYHEEESGLLSWELLTDQKAAGLRELVQHTFDSSESVQVMSLGAIDILFDGYSTYYDWSSRGKIETPWARLKGLRESLIKYGVRLTHSEQHLEDIGFEPSEHRGEVDPNWDESLRYLAESPAPYEPPSRGQSEETEDEEDDAAESSSDDGDGAARELNQHLASLAFDPDKNHKIEEYFQPIRITWPWSNA